LHPKAALHTPNDADKAGCLGARLAGAAQNATRAHHAFKHSEELRRARLPLFLQLLRNQERERKRESKREREKENERDEV
jgi:hypothetical protein